MNTIKTKIIQIGNSKGIRIPKALLEQYDLKEIINITPMDDFLILKSAEKPRSNWNNFFKEMHNNNDDKMLYSSLATNYDKEWEW